MLMGITMAQVLQRIYLMVLLILVSAINELIINSHPTSLIFFSKLVILIYPGEYLIRYSFQRAMKVRFKTKPLLADYILHFQNDFKGGSKNHLIENLNTKSAKISQSTRRIFGYPSLREKFLELPLILL